MKIDEDGIIKMKGKKDFDHNTITLILKLEGQDTTKPATKTQWRLNAHESCWKKFRHKLSKLEEVTKTLFSSNTLSLNDKYAKWMTNIDSNSDRKCFHKK